MGGNGPPTYFKHKPVVTTRRQIRLLQLAFPSNAQELPAAQLKTYDIAVAPPYIALSYSRGEPTGAKTSVTIRINGSLFRISLSLHVALCRIQRAARQHADGGILRLPIWIDEICINQRNVEERSYQVKMMTSIYRNAQSVIVWLPHIASKPGTPGDQTFARVSQDQTFATEILRHEYFTGLWIVQEILVARDLHLLCGESVFLPWSEVTQKTLSSLRELHRKDVLRHRGLLQLLMRKTAIGSMSLQDCISRFCYQQCSDPLDKVFGLMGLVAENEQVVIDYDRSVPEVFLDVVRSLHSRDLVLTQTGRTASGGSSAGLNKSILQDLARQMGLAKQDHGLGATRRFLDLIFKSTSMDEVDSREITHGRNALQIGYMRTFSNVLRVPNRWWLQVDGERKYIPWVVESRSCLHTALSSMVKDSRSWLPETPKIFATCQHRTCKMSLPVKALPAPPVISGLASNQASSSNGSITQPMPNLCEEQNDTAYHTLSIAGDVNHIEKLPTPGQVSSDAETEKDAEKVKVEDAEKREGKWKIGLKGKDGEKEKDAEKGESSQPKTRRDVSLWGKPFALLYGMVL